jgi:single-strand DNA-binding protein
VGRNAGRRYAAALAPLTDSLGKGDRILIVGTVTTDTWADKDTGDKRTMPRVLVDVAGPSLRWATARVLKPQRTSDETGSGEPA